MSDTKQSDRPAAKSGKRMDIPNWVTAIGTAVLAICAAVPLIFNAMSQRTYSSVEEASESSSQGRAEPVSADVQSNGGPLLPEFGEETNDQDTPTLTDETVSVADHAPEANATVTQLCERDRSMMGAYAGYEFTESPFCPTDAVPANRIELAEVPHLE